MAIGRKSRPPGPPPPRPAPPTLLVVAVRPADASTPWRCPTNRTYTDSRSAANAVIDWAGQALAGLGLDFKPVRDIGGSAPYISERINEPLTVLHPQTGDPLLEVIIATVSIPALGQAA